MVFRTLNGRFWQFLGGRGRSKIGLGDPSRYLLASLDDILADNRPRIDLESKPKNRFFQFLRPNFGSLGPKNGQFWPFLGGSGRSKIGLGDRLRYFYTNLANISNKNRPRIDPKPKLKIDFFDFLGQVFGLWDPKLGGLGHS